MRFRRLLFVSGLGAGAGAIAALVAYTIRQPEPAFGGSMKFPTVDEVTLSDETWAIVGLTLLGALVCGTIAMSYTVRKGLGRMMLAALIAAPVGAVLCWGARWLMDQVIYSIAGGPEVTLELSKAAQISFFPWMIWQIAVGFGLTIPVVLAIGVNRFTICRGLIGAGLVIGLGYAISNLVSVLLLIFLVPAAIKGPENLQTTDFARIADTMYLFTLGAATGLAFAIAEVIYKPAWLRSFAGPTEGRTWPLAGQSSRIGFAEGLEVRLPADGFVAPLHAQIQAAEDGHYLIDLVGTSTVNCSPPQQAWLKDGDRIGVGSHQLIYRTRLAQTGKPVIQATEGPSDQGTGQRMATPAIQSSPPLEHHPVLTDPLGRKHELTPGTKTIGRDSSCDIVLSFANSVSRKHAEITVGSTGITIRDLGSTNGTFVNEQPVQNDLPLNQGDHIRLGNCNLKLD